MTGRGPLALLIVGGVIFAALVIWGVVSPEDAWNAWQTLAD